jgi:hypothetical protein
MSGPSPNRRIRDVAIYPLGGQPSDDLSRWTTAEERIAMMWPLALDAWTTSGRALPDYGRQDMPGRVIIRASPPSE